MARPQRSPHLKTSLFVLSLLISTLAAFAQQWEKVDSLSVPYKITSYALDQDGKIYLGSSDGDIFRYDQEGIEDKVFSGINFSSVTTIEPWNRLKLFLFYRENQSIVYLDRFVATATTYQLNNLGIGFTSLSTIGVDNSFWVLESANGELRKYSNNKALIFTTPLSMINLGNASHIRAYQNLLILLDSKNGFYLFDQFGNLITEIPINGASYFQIYNKKVITFDGEMIIEFDPFAPSKTTSIKAPEAHYQGVLKVEDQYLFIQDQRVVKFKLK
ncbi:MAG: hypothetical protein KI791_20205 [Cyclobacteriaceae bacterium]|nr:hypothetical protein [Cyclobacteriaceae bacterium SS2]